MNFKFKIFHVKIKAQLDVAAKKRNSDLLVYFNVRAPIIVGKKIHILYNVGQ